jgi:tRNA(fMet)-specific endonuclease VapC
MNLLFDTNIILWIARDTSGYKIIEVMNPDDKIIYVSFANVVEAQSIAYQNKWGDAKINRMETFFENVRVVEISDILTTSYIAIDSFSQKKHHDFDEYAFKTPRNMGKNDLWIAATASLLNLTLVTTDGDFDHLHDNFLNLRKIFPDDLQSLLK